jgi:hypothetical protein
MSRSVSAPEAAAFLVLVIAALATIGVLFARFLATNRVEK